MTQRTMKLQLPPGTFRAYLFDCDGTVVDSMPLHYIAWKKALDEWNCPFDEELFYAWGGRPVTEIIGALNQRHGLKMPVEATAERKENHYFHLLPQLKPVPEVLEHIHQQHRRIPFGVVSGSNRDQCSSRSLQPICWTSSIPSSPQKITRTASRRPMRFCSRRSGWAWRPPTAWCLKTRRLAFRPQPLPEWHRCEFPCPSNVNPSTLDSFELRF